MTDAEITREFEIRPSSTLLWIAIWAGPVAFAVDMQSRFALVQWTCFNHNEWVLHAITITAFLGAAAGAALAWIAYNRFDRDLHRARFMAMSGFILSVSFAVSIVANAIPHLFLSPCN
jgi:hypothetical protein